MFRQLEQAVELDIIGASSLLHPTWDAIEAALRSTPIVILPFENIPPLFEAELLQALIRGVGARFEDARIGFPSGQPALDTLVVLQTPKRVQLKEFINGLTKHLVESERKSHFVFFLLEDLRLELRRHPCFKILQPYQRTFRDLPQDPKPTIVRLTSMSDAPDFVERGFPELIFYAAVLKLEGVALEEDELQPLKNTLLLLEGHEEYAAYFPWDSLPRKTRLAQIYMSSLDLRPSEESAAKADEQFYFVKACQSLRRRRLWGGFLDLSSKLPPSERQLLERINRLERIQASTPLAVEAVDFWQRVGVEYLLTEHAPPRQHMRISTGSWKGDPRRLKQVLKTARVLGVGDGVVMEERWKDAGQYPLSSLFTLVGAADSFPTAEVLATAESALREYSRRVPTYSSEESTALLAKIAQAAWCVEACFRLRGETGPDELVGHFARLWRMTLERVHPGREDVRGRAEPVEKWLHLLSALDERYGRALQRPYVATLERVTLETQLQDLSASRDILEDFFTLYSSQLKAHDYFLNLSAWRQIALPLAEKYVELDSDLLAGRPPFGRDYQEQRDLINLIAFLQAETSYDRIFVLLLDAFSYLEWKLVRHDILGFAEVEEAVVSEDYRLAPIPTYTPANTTAVLTSYRPSEIGVCDWMVKPRGLDPISVKELSQEMVDRWIPDNLSRNTLSIASSHVRSGLSFIHRRLANVSEIEIPSTEHRSAIGYVTDLINTEQFQSQIVAIYIADFDNFGHRYLPMDGWAEYHSVQARRLKEALLRPIARRARRLGEKTLVVLTADHGKLSRYESRLLAQVVPETQTFRECIQLLGEYPSGRSSRHLVAWVPDSRVSEVEAHLRAQCDRVQDVELLVGSDTARVFPHHSMTELENPNVVVLSRFGLRSGNMAHGAGSLSEVVVPAIRFEWEGN